MAQGTLQSTHQWSDATVYEEIYLLSVYYKMCNWVFWFILSEYHEGGWPKIKIPNYADVKK